MGRGTPALEELLRAAALCGWLRGGVCRSVFAAGLLAWLLKKLIETVGLRPVDRVLGAGFGLLRGAIMLLALALVVNMTPLQQQEGWQASAGARRLDSGLHLLKGAMPENLARYFP